MRKAPNPYQRGMLAEYVALLVLLMKGYWPIAHRYKTHTGEIDWIVRRVRVLVFVEVKWRIQADDAAYAISEIALARYRRTAEHFLKYHTQYANFELRFDAVLLAAYPVIRCVTHLKNVGS